MLGKLGNVARIVLIVGVLLATVNACNQPVQQQSVQQGLTLLSPQFQVEKNATGWTVTSKLYWPKFNLKNGVMEQGNSYNETLVLPLESDWVCVGGLLPEYWVNSSVVIRITSRGWIILGDLQNAYNTIVFGDLFDTASICGEQTRMD